MRHSQCPAARPHGVLGRSAGGWYFVPSVAASSTRLLLVAGGVAVERAGHATSSEEGGSCEAKDSMHTVNWTALHMMTLTKTRAVSIPRSAAPNEAPT